MVKKLWTNEHSEQYSHPNTIAAVLNRIKEQPEILHSIFFRWKIWRSEWRIVHRNHFWFWLRVLEHFMYLYLSLYRTYFSEWTIIFLLFCSNLLETGSISNNNRNLHQKGVGLGLRFEERRVFFWGISQGVTLP